MKEVNIQVMSFEDLLKVNVDSLTDKKNGLTYLPWSSAWVEFKKCYPMATYKVIKNEEGKPYFKDEILGIMCHTEVTVPYIDDGANLTYEMWLPVMDGANKAMLMEKYTYKVKEYIQRKWTGKYIDKEVQKANMFDINKTIMRCLVKNLAMFGLGTYIYSGEDIPKEEQKPIEKPSKRSLEAEDFTRAVKTIEAGKYSSEELESRFNLSPEQQKTIVNLKNTQNG